MRFITHLLSPNNTGAPDYNICGQAASVIDQTNLKLVLNLSDGNTTSLIFSTTDLSTASLTPALYTFGDLDLDVIGSGIDAISGLFYIDINFYHTGTTDVTTCDKIFMSINVEKSGYQSYNNVIQLYGYDVGNDTTLGYLGNTDFNIHLINNTNNLDIYGRQTKAFSKFAVLRQPFTDNVYFYNLVGTQGTIVYKNSTGVQIGTGQYGLICVPLTSCDTNEITIEQTIQVVDIDCVLLDTCISEITDTTKVWLPKVSNTSSCSEACNDCINDISEVTVSNTIDYLLVTPFNINNVLSFLTEYMTETVEFKLFDFQNIEIDSQITTLTVPYASWILDPAVYLVPTTFVITTPPLGDVKVTIEHKYVCDDTVLSCTETIAFPVCHWWSVNKGIECGDYLVNNCSFDTISVVLQKLNNDKVFEDILTITINPSSTETISLQADGIYMLKVPSRDIVDAFEYYSLPSFCNVEACWLNYLNNVICNKPTDECKIPDHYKFNAFLINAHTFFMMLNEEMNFSFIYNSISDERLNNLYTLDSFITRFNEYCNPADSPCIPCQSN